MLLVLLINLVLAPVLDFVFAFSFVIVCHFFPPDPPPHLQRLPNLCPIFSFLNHQMGDFHSIVIDFH